MALRLLHLTEWTLSYSVTVKFILLNKGFYTFIRIDRVSLSISVQFKTVKCYHLHFFRFYTCFFLKRILTSTICFDNMPTLLSIKFIAIIHSYFVGHVLQERDFSVMTQKSYSRLLNCLVQYSILI